MIIKDFKSFNESKGSNDVELTKEERDYLFSKFEFSKKKRATETESDLFKYIKGDVNKTDEETFIKILNSLEYSFKNKLKDGTMRSDVFKSIQAKIPESWIGTKFSRIDTNKNRLDRKKKDE